MERWGNRSGVYGYPIELASAVAVDTVRACAGEIAAIREVVFCCFSAGDLAIYQAALGKVASG